MICFGIVKISPHAFLAIDVLRPPRLTWRGRLVVSFIGLIVCYCLGMAAFVLTLPKPYTTLPPQLDGLAVFTGGSGRVKTALRMVQSGFQGPVLISGANPETTLADILAQADLSASLNTDQQRQLMLDGAQTTHENVLSLNLWATTTGVQRVGVITSTYHAARVWVLGQLLAREVHMVLLPVQPEDMSLKTLWREYNKLLVAPFLR
jgi:uncharacterized SAM-binding protein YcdF (DUF218 family)